MELGIREVKNELSKLIDAAMAGTDVVITKHGKPLVRLVPATQSTHKSRGRSCLNDVKLPVNWDSRQFEEEISHQFEDLLPL